VSSEDVELSTNDEKSSVSSGRIISSLMTEISLPFSEMRNNPGSYLTFTSFYGSVPIVASP
jgi:hypothetical protein